jgi:hypothetical protein
VLLAWLQAPRTQRQVTGRNSSIVDQPALPSPKSS